MFHAGGGINLFLLQSARRLFVECFIGKFVERWQGRRNYSGQPGHGLTNIFSENGRGQSQVGVVAWVGRARAEGRGNFVAGTF